MRTLTLGLAGLHPYVGDIRSIGLFGAIELVKDDETREWMAPFNGNGPEMNAFRQSLLSRVCLHPLEHHPGNPAFAHHRGTAERRT